MFTCKQRWQEISPSHLHHNNRSYGIFLCTSFSHLVIRGEEITEDVQPKRQQRDVWLSLYCVFIAYSTCALPAQVAEDSGAMQELQLLVQSLTRKVGEAEERYSLLKEQTDSLKELLATEKEQYVQKENMYKQNVSLTTLLLFGYTGMLF